MVWLPITVMRLEYISYQHPRIYRLGLAACIVVLTLGGVGSMISDSGNPKKSAYLELVPGSSIVPAEQKPVEKKEGLDTLTRLPGRDGSASPKTPAAPAPAVPAPATVPVANGDIEALGRSMSAAKFGDQHWPALQKLWTKESNWNPNARNPWSGACGIPQALPCSKIPDMSTTGQLTWGLNYIENRYGNPTNAWRFWQSRGWY